MPDAPGRVERVLNLLALLLDTRIPLTRDEIVREVAGYPAQLSAYRRAFERDKEVLRGMGVPITTELVGDLNEIGYRVLAADYYLPELNLTDDETAALRIAVSAISLGDRAGEGALMKLGGLGDDVVSPIASLPLVPALATLFEAFRRRAVVTFTHRGSTRTLEPWGLSSKRGHWYVVGRDRDRDATRAFRADRIDGDVTVGPPGAFDAPADFRPDDHIEDRPWMLGIDEPVAVRLLVDADHASAALTELRGEATGTPRDDGAVEVELTHTNHDAFRSFLLGFLEHAEVLSPPAARAEVVAWLEAIASPA
ncbi:MAG: helix-turn-helix transcriptional regulator [Actinomycetota bacterium]